MAIKYALKINPRVEKEDLPILPKALQVDFKEIFRPTLQADPYECGGVIPCHSLRGKLLGYRALEIEFEGDPNAYRLVYRIYEKPSPSHVLIISFAKHDSAYEKAKGRRRKK